MNPFDQIQRAQLLMQQRRAGQAEQLLRQLLASEPDLGVAHSLLALCMLEDRNRLQDATKEAEQGIHLSPDEAYAFYVLAVVMQQRKQVDSAMNAIQQAIALDPEDADYHGLQAELFVAKSKWKDALAAADSGLRFDPENQTCSTMRSFALERLGRKQDALAEAERMIKNDPDSAYAHASRGWAMLTASQPKEAQVSFRESLRLQPGNEFARSGMIQAINSNNFIFRMMMQFMTWLTRFSRQFQFVLIIGLWLGVQALNEMAVNRPWLRPYILPISVLYLLFVMLTWIMDPLFNLFLRFHKFGKHLLNHREIWASNTIALVFLVGAIAAVYLVAVSGTPQLWMLAFIFSVYLTIPISTAFATPAGWPTQVATVAAIGFGLLYLAITFCFCFPNLVGEQMIRYCLVALIPLFQFGILVYCFVGASLRNAQPKE